jgi:hypothetical protein
METINLKEILERVIENDPDLVHTLKVKLLNDSTINNAIQKAMKEACEDVIDLCFENSKTCEDEYSYTGNTGSDYPADIIVDKESILSVKKRIVCESL